MQRRLLAPAQPISAPPLAAGSPRRARTGRGPRCAEAARTGARVLPRSCVAASTRRAARRSSPPSSDCREAQDRNHSFEHPVHRVAGARTIGQHCNEFKRAFAAPARVLRGLRNIGEPPKKQAGFRKRPWDGTRATGRKRLCTDLSTEFVDFFEPSNFFALSRARGALPPARRRPERPQHERLAISIVLDQQDRPGFRRHGALVRNCSKGGQVSTGPGYVCSRPEQARTEM